jgi:ABC-type glutathione transport system ATPase component
MTLAQTGGMPAGAGTPPPLLEVRDLTAFAGATRILDGVSLAVQRGRTTGVVGESGSGKSMTALAVLGLLPRGIHVASGSILFEGREVLQAGAEERRKLRGTAISMVFQDPLAALDPVMRIDDQVAETLVGRKGMSRADGREEAVRLLARVEMPEPEVRARQYPHQLSGGQRQRVVIAMALAGGPRLLLADEPTTALDVTTQSLVLELLRRLQREDGLGMMLISHDLRVMAHYADDLVVMRGGKVVEHGQARQVLAHPQAEYTRRLIADVPVLGRRALAADRGIDHAAQR